MERWIIPSAITLLVLIIFFPWILIILGVIIALYWLIVAYYALKTPPPYLSTDGTNIIINWFTRGYKKTAIKITEIGDEKSTQTFFPKDVIENKFTGKFTIYSEIIADLLPGRKYSYEIVQVKQNGKEYPLFRGKNYYFNFPDKNYGSQKPFRTIVFGDLQPKSLTPPLLQLFLGYKMKKQNPDLIIFLGDHTMEGSEPLAWRIFYQVLGMVLKNTPMIGVPGNHDLKLTRDGNSDDRLRGYLTYVNYPANKRTYAIRLNGLHIIAFDFLEDFSPNSVQYKFLKEQMEERNMNEFLICTWHTSPYNTVRAEGKVEIVREHIVPIIKKNGGKIWFGGHEHAYQRFDVDGVHYITSGATSSFHFHNHNEENMVKNIHKFHFMVVDKLENQLNIKAISFGNEVLDEFNIKL